MMSSLFDLPELALPWWSPLCVAIQETTFHDAAMSQNPGTLGTINKLGFKSLEVAGCALDKLGRIQIPAVLLSSNFRTCPAGCGLSCLATGPRGIYATVHPSAQLARRLLPVIHFFSRVLVFEEGRCVQERRLNISAIESWRSFLYVTFLSSICTWPIATVKVTGGYIFHSCV